MRVALITGASSGIGLATTRQFLNQGVAVVAIGRNPDKLRAAETACANAPAPLSTLALDVTDDDAPRRAVAHAMQTFGRLDHLINNAGEGSPEPVHNTDDAMLDRFLNLMLRAPFRFAREALTVFGTPASMVHVSSTYALVGGLRGGAYSTAKAGLHGLSSHLACQYGAAGIRSNVVAPGVIPTPMTENRLEVEAFRRMNYDMTPAAGWGSAEDVARAIWFLASPDSSWINGQVLAVDGGWTATKYMSEAALSAERDLKPADWSHSGRPVGDG